MVRAKLVPPIMKPYKGRYPRKFLYEEEVCLLVKAAFSGTRNGLRNALIIWMMYRHGLRISEACSLKWWDFNFPRARVFIPRKKNGKQLSHELSPTEITFLLALWDHAPEGRETVFVSERGNQIGENTVFKMIKTVGKLAGLSIPIHSHMLRHGCGQHLVNRPGTNTRQIQERLGHKDIRHTEKYTEIESACFDGTWPDPLERWGSKALKNKVKYKLEHTK